MTRFGVLLVAMLLFTTPAWAQRPATCILLGDSIDSFAVDGRASDIAARLVERERNVSIRNFSSPGATLSRSDRVGFNSETVTDAMDIICGLFNSCDCVIIAVGSNDFMNATSWSDIEQSVTRILRWAEQGDRKVLMLDLIWRSRFEGGARNHMGMTWAQYRSARATLCRRAAEVCTYAPRPPEFNVATPSLFSARERRAGDLTHLNAAGHRARATWIAQAGAGASLF